MKNKIIINIIALTILMWLLVGCASTETAEVKVSEEGPGLLVIGAAIEDVQSVGFEIIEIKNNQVWPNPLVLDRVHDVVFINRGNSSVRLSIDDVGVDTFLRPFERYETRIEQSLVYEFEQKEGEIILRS